MPQVLMPALSPTMEEGKLAKWLKRAGDPVKSGDVIAEIETDKATMEVEAVDEGTLSEILVPEGTENVKVNTPIAVIAGDGEEKGTAPPLKGGEKSAEAAQSPASVPAKTKPAESKGDERPAAAPAKAPAESGIEPEIPEGAEMITMTVREALRQAMSEEMRRDSSVFLMGEEVGQYQGAYKISQGMLDEFGPTRV